MKYFDNKSDCLAYALNEIVQTLQNELERMRCSDREHYEDEDRGRMEAIITDVESIEEEAHEVFKKHEAATAPRKMLQIKNSNGRKFNVRLVVVGDKYGLDDCLTHPDRGDKSDPLVEFYDAMQDPKKFGDRGQFVSRYYLRTLKKDSCKLSNNGLCLHGGVPEWNVDARAMAQVMAWLSPADVEF